jgi:hypothetical protein
MAGMAAHPSHSHLISIVSTRVAILTGAGKEACIASCAVAESLYWSTASDAQVGTRRNAEMTRLAMAILFSIISFEASAVVRYMVQGMSCAEVQEALDRDGIAILYRQGTSGVTLYDRFVKDGSFCAAGYTSAQEQITAADTDECRVTKCIEVRRFGD